MLELLRNKKLITLLLMGHISFLLKTLMTHLTACSLLGSEFYML
jgi:hypothetical protein